MTTLDALFTITCAHCGVASPALSWCERPISGQLPAGEYQCPTCATAFRRESTNDTFHPVCLRPISPCL